ncbi:MAG: hypothetical protein CVU48_00410 [Candidatus Cloacimonetes bacterium HGW-Cloacimonetes-1]|jgi:uncharacterized protein (DUF302 family)|nr:MAG: hypothetical protein CVU48_00410 [Candidatus Cloacimonetes bacterium HGW-Cloacimonetes-1]
MLLTITTEKSVADTAKALQAAVVNHKFGVMQVHNLQETMQEKGVSFERECLIYEVCNPHSAKKVLMANMEISTALPCRISIYEENGKTFLATLKPSMMLSMFDVPELSATAADVEVTMLKIMEEAAR